MQGEVSTEQIATRVGLKLPVQGSYEGTQLIQPGHGGKKVMRSKEAKAKDAQDKADKEAKDKMQS
jgi:hypothetical protein